MFQSVKCPLQEQENLSLDSQDPPENLARQEFQPWRDGDRWLPELTGLSL